MFCCVACFLFLSSGSVTGLTWRTQRVGSVEIGEQHSPSSHGVQVGSLSRYLAKDPQVSPTHLWSKGHAERLDPGVAPQNPQSPIHLHVMNAIALDCSAKVL